MMLFVNKYSAPAVGKLLVLVFYILQTDAAELKKGNCQDRQWMCENGDCINYSDLCDGIANCSDGSDEIHAVCWKSSCPAGSFRCAYGACIAKSGKCDGTQDCADNSDELLEACLNLQLLNKSHPPCRLDEIACRNGDCSSGSSCDGIVDCSDGSDESITACYNDKATSCPTGSFTCAYGACISSKDKCNFRNDCADGSDEHYILCNRPKNETNVSIPKPPGRSCTVPASDRTYFSRVNCIDGECALKPGEVINDLQIFLLHCHEPHLPPLNVVVVQCKNGSWTQNHECVRACKPLTSTSLDLNCKYNGIDASCEREVRNGTRATFTCKDGYEHSEVLDYNECVDDMSSTSAYGSWLFLPQHCLYRCGSLKINETAELTPLVNYGANTISNHHPWNAALYLSYHYNRRIHFDQFCGGTLVSPFAVITAAHCIVNETDGERIRADFLWVALGKTSRNWTSEDLDVQKIEVQNIYIPETYAAKNLSWLYDIAILELKTQAVISSKKGIPMPACLASAKHLLSVGAIGQVAGWGLTQDNVSSEVLQVGKFNYQPHALCREYASSVSDDHFCSFERGVINHTTVNRGDSGSGFVKEINGYYYLYGVTSTLQPTNHGFNMSTFTDINHSDIRKFVVETLHQIFAKHKNFPFTPISVT